MNYRTICEIDKYDTSKNEYLGVIRPEKYDAWKQIDPMILLLEGINQFAVKSVRRFLGLSVIGDDDEEIELGHLYLPVQMKEIEIFSKILYQGFDIKGSIMPTGTLYKVHFVVSECPPERDVAIGCVYVTSVGRIEN